MATVTAFTAERSQQIEDTTVVDGDVVGNDLILLQRNGTQINAGNVRGPQGAPGNNGINGSGHIICTSTTRPSLVPADEGKTIYETDTKLVRTWTGTRFRLQEVVICTSLLRPVGLTTTDEGTIIKETDTDLEYVWTGARWQIQPYIVCTSTTRPVGLTTSDIGVKIFELNTSRELVWLGTTWGGSTPYTLAETTSTANSAANTPTYMVAPGSSKSITLTSNRQIRVEVFAVQRCSHASHRIAFVGMLDGASRGSMTYEANRANVSYSGNSTWQGNVNAGAHTFAIGNLSPDAAGIVVTMLAGARMNVIDMGPAI